MRSFRATGTAGRGFSLRPFQATDGLGRDTEQTMSQNVTLPASVSAKSSTKFLNVPLESMWEVAKSNEKKKDSHCSCPPGKTTTAGRNSESAGDIAFCQGRTDCGMLIIECDSSARRTSMTIDLKLTPDEERILLEQARLTGQDLVQYAREIIRERISQTSGSAPIREDLIDHEFVADCARETKGREDIPTIEEVRAILAKVPGSFAQEIIEDREDRF